MGNQVTNLNDTTPAAPSNTRNVGWQADTASTDPTVVRNASANYLNRLVDDDDVSISSPADGDVLSWNAATSRWKNAVGGGGGGGMTTDFSADGSSLSGWTLGSTAPSVATTASTPYIDPPAILCAGGAGSNGYAEIDTAISGGAAAFQGKTITFDCYPGNGSIIDFVFGLDSSGNGTKTGIRMDSRSGHPSGVVEFASFKPSVAFDTENTVNDVSVFFNQHWNQVKIVINAGGTSWTWYLNGRIMAKVTSVTLNGSYICLSGDGTGSGGYFRNILVQH